MVVARRVSMIVVSLFLGCTASPEPEIGDVRRVELAAPFVLELDDGQRVLVPAATLADGREGMVVLHGGVVEATRGAASLEADALRDGPPPIGPHLAVQWRDGRTTAAPARSLGVHATAGFALDGVELVGFDRATLTTDDGDVELDEPLRLQAPWLSWSGEVLRVAALPEDARAAEAAPAAPAPRRSPRRSIPVAASTVETPVAPTIIEDAHARGSSLPDRDLAADAAALAAPGDVCQSTAQCDTATRCVADPNNSDGAFRCLAECVPPVVDAPPVGFTAPDSASCVDDDGCCDPSLVCHNGACEGDGGDAGDDGSVAPANPGGGCDPDGDDVISACDAHPNESCKADQDGDGCADSYDEDDGTASRCSVRVARPNSLAWMLLALAWMRGRGRRRPCEAQPGSTTTSST